MIQRSRMVPVRGRAYSTIRSTCLIFACCLSVTNGARGRGCPPDGQRVRRYRYCFQNCSDQKEQVVCGTTVSQASPQ